MTQPPYPIRIALLFLASTFLGDLPVLAQGADTRNSAMVEFRVTRFDPGDREPPVFRAGSGTRQVEVEVPLTYIAGPFEAPLRDESILDFFQGEAERPAISLEITPAEREHLLLVFFQQGETFRILKVHSPPQRIKGGDRFIITATPNELAIKLGDSEPLVIPATRSAVLAGPPGGGIVSLPVLVSLKQDDGWKLASTEQWPCDPRFRRFLVAYMSPRSDQLVFHSVSERMP